MWRWSNEWNALLADSNADHIVQHLFLLSLAFLNPDWLTAGPRQRSDSWFRVPRDSWPYFTFWRLWGASVCFRTENILCLYYKGQPIGSPAYWNLMMVCKERTHGELRLGSVRVCVSFLPCVDYISSWRSEDGEKSLQWYIIKVCHFSATLLLVWYAASSFASSPVDVETIYFYTWFI
jgi:hypothetical protein